MQKSGMPGIPPERRPKSHTHFVVPTATLAMSRMVVVVTPAWVSNAIEQEIEVNKRRPKVTDIGVVKLPGVVHGSRSDCELPLRKRKRTK